MIPETQDAKVELASFISEAIEINNNKAKLGADLKEIKDTVNDRWDITSSQFNDLVKAVVNKESIERKSTNLTEALDFLYWLETDESFEE